MELITLSHNLRRIRDAKGLSQAALAERAHLSRVAYGSIESGSATPRVDTLLRIAEALEVKLQDLLAPARSLGAVRFRAGKKMASREQVLVRVSRWLEGYAELEALLDDRVPYAFEKLPRAISGKRSGATRAHVAANHARKTLRLDGGASIRDICGILEERAGVKVFALPLSSDAFFGLSVAKKDGGPAVVVNVWDRISVERWIFTAAHELGHLLLHLGAYDTVRADENRTEENEADQFASRFLMPPAPFDAEWDEARGLDLVERVMKVKRIFKVSYKTVLYRLSEDPAYGKHIWPRFQTAYRDLHGRALGLRDEPEAASPDQFQPAMVEPRAAGEPKRLAREDFVEDRLSRLARTAIEKELISVSRAAEILDIDLQQMRARTASWVA